MAPKRKSAKSDNKTKNPLETAAKRIDAARKKDASSLNLSALKLSQLPSEISGLKNLRRLLLSGNQLTSLPTSIGDLENLEVLEFSENQIAFLPESIGNLTNLVRLDFKSNHISYLPTTIGRLTRLQQLSAGSNRLVEIPKNIEALRELRFLYIWQNELSAIPEEIFCLSKLVALVVGAPGGSNDVTTISTNIRKLTNLRDLGLEGCPIESLPSEIGGLSSLEFLNLRYCKLKSLPDTLLTLTKLTELYLHGNTKLELPPEVLGPSLEDVSAGQRTAERPSSILNYYLSKRISRPLNEAKMILVGRGAAGKTSLINRLVHGRYNSHETKTDGIAITQWPIKLMRDTVCLNVWDFGGQEIMHATHQFFLTKRSLYVLVLNAREGEQDSNIEYWLQMIESFGGGSPVIIVINKIKDHPFDLNRRGLQGKFPAIRAFIQTDCEFEIGLDELRKTIFRETDRLEHLRDPFPVSWFKIKDALANLPKLELENFITFSRYQKLCEENGVTQTTSQETLVRFLHDLGIVINFREDPRLAETHVLNPEWVTNGIYRILNADSLAHKFGELRLDELASILSPKTYPRNMHLYLVDLMRKFELCYEFYDSEGHYLIPELLGKEEADLAEFSAPDTLRFEYSYNIVPEGLLPRFIVRSKSLNKGLPRWRTGVILSWEGNRAMVKADLQDRRVSIAVIGPSGSRRRLLAVIRADMEHIHRSVPKLQAVERIPVPGCKGLVIPYRKLQTFEAKGVHEFFEEHENEVISVSVSALLNGVEELAPKLTSIFTFSKNAARIVFSYSHKDEELRDQLETHLKLLQRQQIISTWHDRRILAGDKWKGKIDDNFSRADAILLLVSPDFLASDYCYDVEMQMALEREAKGEVKVIPVILRACDWHTAPFGKLQALPKDGKAITSWANRDEAWNDVAKGIRTAVTEIKEF